MEYGRVNTCWVAYTGLRDDFGRNFSPRLTVQLESEGEEKMLGGQRTGGVSC